MATEAAIYRNETLGFELNIPASLKNYSVTSRNIPEAKGNFWQGATELSFKSSMARSPIGMIYAIPIANLKDWTGDLCGTTPLGDAECGAKELGRNTKFVFTVRLDGNYPCELKYPTNEYQNMEECSTKTDAFYNLGVGFRAI